MQPAGPDSDWFVLVSSHTTLVTPPSLFFARQKRDSC